MEELLTILLNSEEIKAELIKFKEWYDKLSPASKCTVHPPAGSGGSYGLYNMSDEDLIDSYIRKSKHKSKTSG